VDTFFSWVWKWKSARAGLSPHERFYCNHYTARFQIPELAGGWKWLVGLGIELFSGFEPGQRRAADFADWDGLHDPWDWDKMRLFADLWIAAAGGAAWERTRPGDQVVDDQSLSTGQWKVTRFGEKWAGRFQNLTAEGIPLGVYSYSLQRDGARAGCHRRPGDFAVCGDRYDR
jgi:hypothetical protein